mgnify:CR=1 FL=1
MAFDLVHYFAEQIKIQKPQLLAHLDAPQRNALIKETNALTLGKLISLWRQNENTLYQEIQQQDALYIQEVARHLTTSAHNQSVLSKAELEDVISQLLELFCIELRQLDQAGSLGQKGIKELLLGQLEHLSGQAKDWVWSTNGLSELIGSQPVTQEEISLQATMKEFNQMVHQQPDHAQHAEESQVQNTQPGWAKIAEPVVALVVLWVLFQAVQQVFA